MISGLISSIRVTCRVSSVKIGERLTLLTGGTICVKGCSMRLVTVHSSGIVGPCTLGENYDSSICVSVT